MKLTDFNFNYNYFLFDFFFGKSKFVLVLYSFIENFFFKFSQIKICSNFSHFNDQILRITVENLIQEENHEISKIKKIFMI